MEVGQSRCSDWHSAIGGTPPPTVLTAFQIGYAVQGDLRITSTKFIGLNPGS